MVLFALPTGPCRRMTRRLGSIVARGGFEDIDQVIEALVDPVDSVAAAVLVRRGRTCTE